MKNYQSFIGHLKSLISIPSVKGESIEGAPFGKPIKTALEGFASIANNFGFDVINHNGYALEITFGEGKEYGVMGHLDVVPAGNNWNSNPFELTLKDGVYYGRGLCDDKGPMLLCLYALKEIKDSGEPFNAKIRMFVGGDEESSWKDAEYLQNNVDLPEYGFSPDGNFPVSFAEKGMAIITFYIPKLKNFYGLSGGTVVNAVCDRCEFFSKLNLSDELLIKHNIEKVGDKYIAKGKASHGSQPQFGDNAIKHFFELAKECGEEVDNLLDCLFYDKFNLTALNSPQGSVTFSPDIIFEQDENIHIKCDCRFPYPFTYENAVGNIGQWSIPFEASLKHGTQYVERDGDFVSTLLSAYNAFAVEKGEPISQGGSTFARVFKKGVAFGPEFPNKNNLIHQANENISEKDLNSLYDIYLTAFKMLGGIK